MSSEYIQVIFESDLDAKIQTIYSIFDVGLSYEDRKSSLESSRNKRFDDKRELLASIGLDLNEIARRDRGDLGINNGVVESLDTNELNEKISQYFEAVNVGNGSGEDGVYSFEIENTWLDGLCNFLPVVLYAAGINFAIISIYYSGWGGAEHFLLDKDKLCRIYEKDVDGERDEKIREACGIDECDWPEGDDFYKLYKNDPSKFPIIDERSISFDSVKQQA